MSLPQIVYLIRNIIRPDILHSQLVTSFGFLGALCGWRPHILSVLGSDILLLDRRFILIQLAARYSLRQADMVLATSRFLAEETKKVVPEVPVTVTPFGIELRMFTSEKRGKAVSREHHVVGCVKNIRRLSGLEYLIKAVPVILKRCPHTKIIIVGSPHGAGEMQYEQELKLKVDQLGLTQNIEFHQSVPHKDMPELLDSLDVLALPSLSESFGVVALEAQAMEVPVVAFSVGGLRETVAHPQGGFLIEKGNWEELGRRISDLLEDTNLRSRLGEAARQFVVDRYNWKDNCRIMETLYSIVSTRSRGGNAV